MMVNGERSPLQVSRWMGFVKQTAPFRSRAQGPFYFGHQQAASVAVSNSVTGTVHSQTLRSGRAAAGHLTLGTGAQLSLALAGNAHLRRNAGIEVATGRTLSITNAPGGKTATLMVTGGGNGGDRRQPQRRRWHG